MLLTAQLTSCTLLFLILESPLAVRRYWHVCASQSSTTVRISTDNLSRSDCAYPGMKVKLSRLWCIAMWSPPFAIPGSTPVNAAEYSCCSLLHDAMYLPHSAETQQTLLQTVFQERLDAPVLPFQHGGCKPTGKEIGRRPPGMTLLQAAGTYSSKAAAAARTANTRSLIFEVLTISEQNNDHILLW